MVALQRALPHHATPLTGLLARVGNTPLVQLSRVTEGRLAPGVTLFAKLESFNPGGSVKDRAALSMILQAEASGRLRPGMTLLDSSSGNTGIAYGWIAAQRGYKLKLCLPANANAERKATLRAYGVEIIETDPLEGSDGAIAVARRLAAQDPEGLLYLDQYSNDANWQAHFRGTGPEIWRDTDGRVSHWVACLGTSGTFTGTARFLKAQNPDLVAVSVQPDSPFHGLEGLKHMETALVPAIYDPGLADRNIGAPTEESLALVRRLAREEGLFVGPSAGAAAWAALELASTLTEGVVVTLFPDGGERYLSEAHILGG